MLDVMGTGTLMNVVGGNRSGERQSGWLEAAVAVGGSRDMKQLVLSPACINFIATRNHCNFSEGRIFKRIFKRKTDSEPKPAVDSEPKPQKMSIARRCVLA